MSGKQAKKLRKGHRNIVQRQFNEDIADYIAEEVNRHQTIAANDVLETLATLPFRRRIKELWGFLLGRIPKKGPSDGK